MDAEHPLSLVNGDTWTFGDGQLQLLDEVASFYSWLVEETDDLESKLEVWPEQYGPAWIEMYHVKDRFQPVLRALATRIHDGR